MFRGYKIDFKTDNHLCYQAGLELYKEDKASLSKSLAGFVSPSGVLDGSALQQQWFPKINADIFISHSHTDEKLAITLAGWLQKKFGLKAFIDSALWGYADDLLLIIDNNYCKNENENTYNYRKRNASTTHIHMMLATSLALTMDLCECLFFLNTPNSIDPKTVTDNVATAKTRSSWIYNELLISTLIRQRDPKAHRTVAKSFSKGGVLLNESRNLDVHYSASLSHLTDIDTSTLNKWHSEWASHFPKSEYPLDKLYELTEIQPTK